MYALLHVGSGNCRVATIVIMSSSSRCDDTHLHLHCCMSSENGDVTIIVTMLRWWSVSSARVVPSWWWASVLAERWPLVVEVVEVAHCHVVVMLLAA